MNARRGLTAETRLRVPFVAAASLRAGAADIIAVVDIVVDVGRGDARVRRPREGLFRSRVAFERGWFGRARVLVEARGRRWTNFIHSPTTAHAGVLPTNSRTSK